MATTFKNDAYSYQSLADWLRENVPLRLVLSEAEGVTVEALIVRLDALAEREWNDSIDAMGEDA